MGDLRRRIWYGQGLGWLRALLAPLELAYRTAVAARNSAYEGGFLPAYTAPIQVLSVGNLSVGGTGKTPIAASLARELADRGRRPALITRGYGMDEVALHESWNPDVPVIVAKRRIDGVRRAASEGADIALLDDGFQHRSLRRDLDIVLVAAEQPFPAALLPRGPFREPAASLARADFVAITGKSASEREMAAMEQAIRALVEDVPTVRIRLRPSAWTDLDGKPVSAPEDVPLVLASVADPGSVLAIVEKETGKRCDLMAFRDHYEYAKTDIDAIRARTVGRTVATTAKDAVKLSRFADRLEDVRVLHLRVTLGEGGAGLQRALDDLAERENVE